MAEDEFGDEGLVTPLELTQGELEVAIVLMRVLESGRLYVFESLRLK